MGRTGADTGLEGRGWGPLVKKPLEGLPEPKGLSTCRQKDRQTGEVPQSPDGGLCTPAPSAVPCHPAGGSMAPRLRNTPTRLWHRQGGVRDGTQGQPVHRLGRTTPTPQHGLHPALCKGASGRRGGQPRQPQSLKTRPLPLWPVCSPVSWPSLLKKMHLSFRSDRPAIMFSGPSSKEGGSTEPHDLRVRGSGAPSWGPGVGGDEGFITLE